MRVNGWVDVLFHGRILWSAPELESYVESIHAVETVCRCLIRFGTSQQFASARVSWTISTRMKDVTDFQIRPARVQDVPVILQLIRDLATYERAPDEVTATEEQLVDVLFGERPAAEVLLAFEGELPVGFAVYFYNFSTWLGRPGLYLEDLFVKPEKRGKGYGRALLVELAKIARDRGCGRMEWAVLNWNEPAIKFYRALGAKPMDEWTVFRLTRDEIAKLANAADTAATTESK